jgi:hypothetical protein
MTSSAAAPPLLPGASLGQAGIIVAAAGLVTTSGLVVVLYREHQQKIRPGDVGMLVVLLGLYGLQLASAVQLAGSPHNVSGVRRQGVLSIAFFPFGIARSWQLVGARDLSLASTVATVIHRPASETRAQRRAIRLRGLAWRRSRMIPRARAFAWPTPQPAKVTLRALPLQQPRAVAVNDGQHGEQQGSPNP